MEKCRKLLYIVTLFWKSAEYRYYSHFLQLSIWKSAEICYIMHLSIWKSAEYRYYSPFSAVAQLDKCRKLINCVHFCIWENTEYRYITVIFHSWPIGEVQKIPILCTCLFAIVQKIDIFLTSFSCCRST